MHFIILLFNYDWELVKVTLAFQHMKERHTGVNIQSLYNCLCQDFGKSLKL